MSLFVREGRLGTPQALSTPGSVHAPIASDSRRRIEGLPRDARMWSESGMSVRMCGLFATVVLVAGGIAFWAGTGAVSLSAEEFPPPSVTYQQRLNRPCGLYWTEVPLRQGLDRLAEVQRVSIFLDRRVDPDQRVTISLDAASLRELLETLAAKLSLGVSYFEPIVYLGPPAAARRLRTLAALRQEELPSRDRRREMRKPLAWPSLSTPREILRSLCQEAGVTPDHLEEIPHDLWPAVRLPAMSWTDRMTLVLIGFDDTFRIDPVGNRVTFVPVSADPVLTRRVSLPPRAAPPAILAQQVREQLPDVSTEIVGGEVVAHGPLESLEKLAEVLSGGAVRKADASTSLPTTSPAVPSEAAASPPDSADPFSTRRFTARQGQGTLGGVIRQLSSQLEMTVQLDADDLAACGLRLDRRITFAVQNGTVDDLWRAVLQPQGLSFQRRGREIRIFPADPSATP